MNFQLPSAVALLLASMAFSAYGAIKPYVWKNVPIVGGGYITGVVVHPTEPGLVYTKTDIGGAYRRDSATTPWVPITDWISSADWTYSGIESLAVDPSDANAVYIAGGTYTNSWSGPGAILRSHDRGKTWAVTKMPFKMGGNETGRGQGERLAVDPNDGRVLYLGTRKDGLWRSENRGETWKAVEGFPTVADTSGIGTVFVMVDPASAKRGTPSQTIYAGVNSPTTPLLRSTDAGKTWSPVPNAPKGLVPHRAAWGSNGALLITFSNVAGPNDVTNGAFYRFDPAATTWADISPLKPSDEDKFGYAGVTVDPKDPNIIIVTTLCRWTKGDDLLRSRDGGKTWTSMAKDAVRDAAASPWLHTLASGPNIGHWISDIDIDPADSNHVIYPTGWTMWESHNANAVGKTQWTVAAAGIEEGVINEVLSPPSGANVLSIMWDLDGFRHTDVNVSPKAGFFKPQYARNTSIDFAESDPNFVVRVYGGQEMGGTDTSETGGSYSLDNGVTWIAFPKAPVPAAKDGFVAVAADASSIVWTPQGQATVVSRDRGATWTLATGLPWNLRVVSDRRDAKAFYTYDASTGVIYASSDGGSSFAAKAMGLPLGECYLRASPSGSVYLATPTGLLRSDDRAATFNKLPGLQSVWRVGFGKSPTGADAVYAIGVLAGDYGFYRLDAGSDSWVRINDSANQFMEITSISGDPRVPGRVYVSSRSRGILMGEPAGD